MLDNLPNGLNVIACRDLADFTHDPGSIYRFFSDYHKSEYDPSERIVLYTQHLIPEKLWRHLYEAANLIDISNFFIMICHVSDILSDSRIQAEKWSIDPVPFQTYVIKDIPTSGMFGNNYELPESLCPLPWMHLEIRNQGQISPCCVYQGTMGDINSSRLDLVLNGHSMSALRQEFLDGKRPAGCQTCWKNEDRGLTSNRLRHVSLLKKKLTVDYLHLPTVASLDIKPGTTCNFKCRICGPESSSLFAQETAAHSKIHIQSRNWSDDDQVFHSILDQSANLINLDMYGGEPFLIKNLTQLITRLATDQNAKNIKLHYNSNGSIYPEKLINIWHNFQHVDLHFSIDDIGARFEIQRGGSWKDVEQNIMKIKANASGNVKISIMPVISIMNVLYLDELIEWAESQNLPINELYLQDPREFSIHSMPQHAKNAVIEKYQNSSHPILKAVSESLRMSPSDDSPNFIAKTLYFDVLRKQDFSESHPEIAQLMGYVKMINRSQNITDVENR